MIDVGKEERQQHVLYSTCIQEFENKWQRCKRKSRKYRIIEIKAGKQTKCERVETCGKLSLRPKKRKTVHVH